MFEIVVSYFPCTSVYGDEIKDIALATSNFQKNKREEQQQQQ